MQHVFVFGTLKEGFPNFGINRGTRLQGQFRTRESWPLYLVGERHSPWMLDTPGIGHNVIGEVFEVSDEVLQAMDRLERIHEPDGYRRVRIALSAEAGGEAPCTEAFAYLIPAALLTPELPRIGPLAEYTRDHALLYRKRTA
jgi:gamma-glutamylaminecyclotransferase